MSTSSEPIQENLRGSPDRFINRELSDLAFICRVLEEAQNTNHPLFERIRFLSISADVLNEFYTVRVAKLRQRIVNEVSKRSPDGLTPRQQLAVVNRAADELMADQQCTWRDLDRELRNNNIVIAEDDDLSGEDVSWLKGYFDSHIFPVLTPFTVDGEHPFPYIPSEGICIVIELCNKKTSKRSDMLMPLPHIVPRFVRMPGEDVRFVTLETMISLFWTDLFPNQERIGHGLFQLLRDNELAIEERSNDLMKMVEHELTKRSKANVIRLKVNDGMPENLRQFVALSLGILTEQQIEEYEAQNSSVTESEYIAVDGLLGLADTAQLIAGVIGVDFPDLTFSSFSARMPNRLRDFSDDCFEAVKDKDLLVHWPYESFDVVANFLHQAAADPNVLAIKQTLYRTSDDSPIVDALVRAAEAGKSVTAVVELEARDNEHANIALCRRMEAAGAQVIYGIIGLKVHCKATLVVRREADETALYVHFGTGNYHPGNARIYTDLSYFSRDAELGQDATKLFNYLTSSMAPTETYQISIAPHSLRYEIFDLIDDEMAFAKEGKPATIWLKLNSLTDPAAIDKLYDASNAGVHIELIVRRHCSLRPGIKGLSETIRVKSIVGRFLEHSRIFCFGNGHPLPSDNSKVFFSSADWMTRNFDGRVEIMIPIHNETIHNQMQDQIMVANLNDEAQSWLLQADGSYVRHPNRGGFSAQEYFMKHPSLSGLGTNRDRAEIPTLTLKSVS